MGSSTDGIKPTVTVNVGGGSLRNEGTSYGVGKFGITGEIPVSKKISLVPMVSAHAGQDVKGISAAFGVQKQLNSKLSINAGIGFDNNRFKAGEPRIEEKTIISEKMTPNQGESDLRMAGDFHEQVDITREILPKTGTTTGYMTAGAKYKLNSHLSLSAAVQGGITKPNGQSTIETRYTDREYVTKGAEIVYNPDIDMYVFRGGTEVAREQSVSTTVQKQQSVFTGALKAGVDYNINRNLAVGVQGQVGVGNYSTSYVGANLKVKF